MTWVAFADPAAFVAFHDTACADHGIPHPGRNDATGEVEPLAAWTTAYVAPWDDHGRVIADVSDEDLERYGLDLAEPPPRWVDPDTGEPVADPPTPVTWDFHKDPGDRLREVLDAESD